MSAGLGGLGVASGALSAWVATWQWLLLPVSAGFLAWAYYRTARRGDRRRYRWLWLGLTTPVTVFFWMLPYLGR